MADRILTLRDLNRATLARQMLLAREKLSVPAAIERLVGLQAQLSSAPFVGLWTRLNDFRREDLARLIEDRTVVKATLMRGTLHTFTADDYCRFRSTLQPILTQGWSTLTKGRPLNFDLDKLLAAGHRFIDQEPRTFAEITSMVSALVPGHDPGPMRYAIRTHLPLVQVPVTGAWSYPNNPKFALAESWIGRSISPKDNLRQLVYRYLAAFGPASAVDMQTWLGASKLKDTFAHLASDLRTYRDEQRRELFDLPDLELPAGEEPAPIRFLPEFDNLLLSHSKRTRVVADEHRPRVFLPGLRVAPTILIDGFAGGVWKIEKSKTAASLVIEPFDKVSKRDRTALSEEGERLVRFIEPNAKSFEVRVSS